MAARVFDATGSYHAWLWGSVAMMLFAAGLAWTLRGAQGDQQGRSVGSIVDAERAQA